MHTKINLLDLKTRKFSPDKFVCCYDKKMNYLSFYVMSAQWPRTLSYQNTYILNMKDVFLIRHPPCKSGKSRVGDMGTEKQTFIPFKMFLLDTYAYTDHIRSHDEREA